jgi:hypothetical protein
MPSALLENYNHPPNYPLTPPTLIKKNQFFPHIYKEIQSGAVAKSLMRKGFPIY